MAHMVGGLWNYWTQKNARNATWCNTGVNITAGGRMVSLEGVRMETARRGGGGERGGDSWLAPLPHSVLVALLHGAQLTLNTMQNKVNQFTKITLFKSAVLAIDTHFAFWSNVSEPRGGAAFFNAAPAGSSGKSRKKMLILVLFINSVQIIDMHMIQKRFEVWNWSSISWSRSRPEPTQIGRNRSQLRDLGLPEPELLVS